MECALPFTLSKSWQVHPKWSIQIDYYNGGALLLEEIFLANHKSALKRNRQNEKRNERNKVGRTRIKNAIKNTLIEIDKKNKT